MSSTWMSKSSPATDTGRSQPFTNRSVQLTSRSRRALALAGMITVGIIGCRHDFTSPHADPVVGIPVVVQGPTAARSTINSPELTPLPLGAVDPESGSASVVVNVPFPYPTVVTIEATGDITKTANKPLYYWYQKYPSGTMTYPAAGDASVVTSYPWDNRSYIYEGTPKYVLMRSGEVITAGRRSSKPNEVWNPGCGPTWSQCYIYCEVGIRRAASHLPVMRAQSQSRVLGQPWS